MPGLSLFKFSDPDKHSAADLSQVFKQNCYFDDYAFSVIKSGEAYLCSLNYPGYHYCSWEDDRFEYWLDGILYDYPGDQTKNYCRKFADEYFMDKDPTVIREYFRTIDAEFVLVIQDKATSDIILLNDVFGRLPIYIYQKNNDLIISRDMPVILSLVKTDLNNAAFTDILFLGYPTGDRTLYENIDLLLGGCFIDIVQEQSSWKSYNVFDFRENKSDELSLDDTVKKAGELFLDAMQKRLNLYKDPVISLSGGLDSRALCGAVNSLNSSCPAYTYLDYKGNAANDLKIARKISSAHHITQYVTELPAVSTESLRTLFTIKAGMNYLGMGFLIPYLKNLSKRFDCMFTGDGGDKVLPDIRPMKKLKSVPSLLNYIEIYHGLNSLTEVAGMTGKDETSLRLQYHEFLEKLPAENINMKYVYFVIKNRAFRWLFEGEDRNRCFLPSCTPFYAYPIFEFLINIPSRYKENFRFFEAFLENIAPASKSIINANWGVSIEDHKKINHLYFKQRLKSEFVIGDLYRLINKKSFKSRRLKLTKNMLVEALINGANHTDIFDNRDYVRMIKDADDTIFHLLTFLWSKELISAPKDIG